VWNGKRRLVEYCTAVQQEIEIERASGASKWPLASPFAFDLEKRVQQVPRAECRFPNGGGIEECGLNIGHIDRKRVVESRDAELGEQRSQPVEGKGQVGFAIAEVGPEADSDDS